MNAHARFEDAVAWQQRGDAGRAEAVCIELLRVQPGHADAWHLRGLLAFQNSHFERGVKFIRHSLALNARQPAAHVNIGAALLQIKRPTEALGHFESALALQYESAATFYGRGCALLQLGRAEEALADFDRALKLEPELAPAMMGRGQALQQLKRLEEALACLDHARSLAPADFDVLVGRGNILLECGRYEDSLASYDLAAAAGAPTAESLNNRGNALRKLSRIDEALVSYQQALALDATAPETLNNCGGALFDLNRLPEALACFEVALKIRPDYTVALENCGLAALMAYRPEQAARCYARLLQVAPNFNMASSNLLHARGACCDWAQYDEDCARVNQLVEQGKPVQPFAFIAISDSAAAQRQCAERFAQDEMQPVHAPLLWSGECYRHERIRVAYLSGDLREHAVSTVMAGVWERHDRERIESIAVSLQPADRSATGQRVKAAFEQYIDVSQRSDREIAQLLRAMEVDIAVDLMGFTRRARPGILAHRPAPVQVNYLGYPGTMGSSVMDYMIADEMVIAEGQERWYREQVVRLPHCYLPVDDRREVAGMPTRSEAGLPERGQVYCAFTNAFKISPLVFAIWMRLLREVQGSVLWLRGMPHEARANIMREAESRGVDAKRLVFAPHVASMAEHLGRQRLADLYLDTLPYNAHSTVCDALWAGVPVLTCAGGSFAGRVAASALTAVGLVELITQNLEHYERRALELAHDPLQLQSLRGRLAECRDASPLFDTAGYTRHLEAAYAGMHQLRMRGKAPCGFRVAAKPSRTG
ncbi:MAG: tetratricopeptide repeat protein [Steroidobacteraceae bacterium]